MSLHSSLRKALLLALPALMALPACARERAREGATITGIHPITGKRPSAPGMQNYTRVYINDAPWSAGDYDCRSRAFDVDNSETSLLTAIYLAWSKGKTISVYVEDTMKLPNEDVCIATAIHMN